MKIWTFDNLFMRLSAGEIWAYIGGIIDGEGCITLEPLQSINLMFVPVVQVTNTKKELLDMMAFFCGYYGIDSKVSCLRKETRKHASAFIWRVRQQKSVLTFCTTIEKYLFLKRRHAAILIEYIMLRTVEGQKGTFLQDKRLNLYEEIKFLNKKGPR